MVTGRARRAMHQTQKTNTPRLNPPTGMTLVERTPAPFHRTLSIFTLGAGAVRLQPTHTVGLITLVGAPPGATKKGVSMNPKKRVRPTASLKPVLASRNEHHLGAFPFFCYTGPQAGASFLKPKWVSKSQLLDNFFGLALAACRTFF